MARFTTLLLEKWRVVGSVNGECNFHIFYSILQGLSSQEKFDFELGNVADYHILAYQVGFIITILIMEKL